MNKFMLEEILAAIKSKGLEKELSQLEISTNDKTIRIPLAKIGGLALVEEQRKNIKRSDARTRP